MLNPGESAFLVLCEELNFTRAAERCHMTQQGLSAHIRKLEEAYGTKLFVRVPRVELTESGRAVRDALLRQESLDKDLIRRIREIDRGAVGSVRFGMNGARAAFAAPALLDSFYADYPDVEMHFTTGDTRALAQLLRQGKLDGFLGVDAEPDPEIEVEPLVREKVYLVGRKDGFAAFRKMSGTSTSPGDRASTGNHASSGNSASPGDRSFPVYSLEEMLAHPQAVFVRNSEGSTLNRLVDRSLEGMKCTLRTAICISDYYVQLALCKDRGLFMFCPASIALAEHGPVRDPVLMVAEAAEIREELEISLVTGAGRHYPACAKTFFDSVRKTMKKRMGQR